MESDAVMRQQPPSIRRHVLDKQDYKIISLMTQDLDNKTIAEELRTPLSTVQRRSRVLLREGYVKHKFQPDYHKLGLKNGLLHIYTTTGNMKQISENLLSYDGIMSTGVHVGNSDITAEFVYENSEQITDLISHVKAMNVVDKTVWSEEAYLQEKEQGLSTIFNGIIDRL